MKNGIKANYIYSLLYEILALLIPLITTPYVSRVLGATAIGDYNYTAGIVSYFGLFAATGTKIFGQREISKAQGHTRSVLFWDIFVFRSFCTVFVLVLYFVFVFSTYLQYRLLFLVQLATIFSYFFDISWFFQGVENFKVTAIRNSLVKITGTILIFLCVKCTDDLCKYALILASTLLLGNLSMWPYLTHEVDFVNWKELQVIRLIMPVMQLFIPVIAIQLYTVFDKIMLGYLCNTTEVGYYSQAEKVIKLAITVLSSLISVLLPRLSILFSQNNTIQFKNYYQKIIDYIFLLAIPMQIGCLTLTDVFVPIFFGEGYQPVVILMKIECLLFSVLCIGQLFGNILVATNKESKYTIAVGIAAIVNLLLNYVLIKIFAMGSVGAVLASVVAEIMSSSIQYMFVKQFVDTKIITKSFINYVFPGIVMGITILAMKPFMGNGVISLAITGATGVIIYILILIVKKDNMTIYILDIIFSKIKLLIIGK